MRLHVALGALSRRISMLPDGVYVGVGVAAAGWLVKTGIIEAAKLGKEALAELPGGVKKEYGGVRFLPSSEAGVLSFRV